MSEINRNFSMQFAFFSISLRLHAISLDVHFFVRLILLLLSIWIDILRLVLLFIYFWLSQKVRIPFFFAATLQPKRRRKKNTGNFSIRKLISITLMMVTNQRTNERKKKRWKRTPRRGGVRDKRCARQKKTTDALRNRIMITEQTC